MISTPPLPDPAAPARHDVASRGALGSRPSGPLAGTLALPGDRGVASRALALGALAIGETVLSGISPSADLDPMLAALRAFGAEASYAGDDRITVRGLGVGGLLEPEAVIDCGDRAATAELLLGLAAGHGFATTFTGGRAGRAESLTRIIDPLRRMGVGIISRSRDRLPLSVRGPETPLPADLKLSDAAAEAKAALLLAALSAPGVTSLTEAATAPDAIETLLPAFGAALEIEDSTDGARTLRLEGRRDLKPQKLVIPGDPVLAAFPMVAALIVEGSAVRLRGAAMGRSRLALVETLTAMGATITLSDRHMAAGEPVADLVVAAGPLKAVTVAPARAAALFDVLPALAVAAAFADGRTVIEGLGALRRRAGDPIGALVTTLRACGVACEEGPESLAITGAERIAGGSRLAAPGDGALAMALLVLGLRAEEGVVIEDAGTAVADWPGFAVAMGSLGAAIASTDSTAA
ncbi:3-phosphoshikimate 1-carboxyvinyltransferase [Kaistia geumhonensis]|uniref:3-phosphoshikimate 1-carboxyvinyltransferase n=1 Tax=Kaistia geumhonensis TaxID=410839 RepID=A0ABU0M7Y3_9HYPH|nr:3-phosphoshikimate 1-carboxyvinyltransferase [Kaistia geumhonensis]MCX5477904.1 3-phosphoshikimate 1-carboxyvinyltransferase [Kaistia geumhonensis]MDQ0516883.1 3-phosphoshikimate 1-carboxyvinyltransferase [Kaistia geumhonensis]